MNCFNDIDSTPCEWYRNYVQFCHLLHPNILNTAVLSTGGVTAISSTAPMSTETINNSAVSISSAMDVVINFPAPTLPAQANTAVTAQSTSSYGEFPDRSQARVLIAGCGNSLLPFDMIRDGWTGGLVGIDFASNAIHQMQTRLLNSNLVSDVATERSKQPKEILDFICADLTQPLHGYDLGSFDLILVKGTFDAILCSDSSRANAMSFIRNCVQLLSPNHGVLLIITTGNPDNRLEYLEYHNELSFYWRNVSVHPLRNPNHNFDMSQPPYVGNKIFAILFVSL
jgi:SAM-dependent methyltransferase